MPIYKTGQHLLRCLKCHLPIRQAVSRKMSSLQYEEDQYNGVTIDLSQLSANTQEDQFDEHLHAAKRGFSFHHAEGNTAMLKLWLDSSRLDMTPQFATHQIGASGFVLREDLKQVLVIKDKNSKFNLWKFPGGLSNLGEDIGDTAVREVFEETGVETEFISILAFRQQHLQPGAFGRSDIYVVCRLRPLTFDLSPCSAEVKDCKWMGLEELRQVMDRSPITRRLVDLVRYGISDGFHNIDIMSEEMASVHRGLRYNLHHRELPEKWKV